MAYISTFLKKTIVINRIVTIHYFEYAPDFYFKGESHDFWEFVCVDAGIVEIGADEKKHILKDGMAIFHKPMEFHTIRSMEGTAPNLLILSFECNSKEMQFFKNCIVQLTSEEKNILSRITVEAENAFSTPLNVPSIEKVERAPFQNIGAEQMIKNLLELLFITILRRENSYSIKTSLPVPHKYHVADNKKNSRILQQIIHYLIEHLEENLQVSQIASDNLLGKSQLQDLFHKEFGCGVIQAFSDLKIDKAKQFIREEKFSFKEIADMLGYHSLPYFSRQFKKIVGVSPREYARTIKSISEHTSSALPQENRLLKR